MFIRITFQDTKKVKRIRHYTLKCKLSFLDETKIANFW